MSVAALACVALVYTLFFGRNKVVLNKTIYENERLVGQPGAEQLATHEGYGLTSFGENGLIVDKALDPDAVRVLFVGDSFVKAKQVSDRFKFTELVERAWNEAHPERPVQTLNVGLGSQDMATYLRYGPNMDRHFAPDLVFLYASATDFRVLSRNPARIAQIAAGDMSRLTRPQASTPLEELASTLGVRSFLGRLQQQFFGFRTMGVLAQRQVTLAQAEELTPAGDEDAAIKELPGIDGESLGVQLDALLDIWGDRLVILYRVPVPKLGRDAPDTYLDQVMQGIEHKGIPCISLYEPMLHAYRAHTPPAGFDNSILGTGHLNRIGHQVVADQVIQYMESRHDLY